MVPQLVAVLWDNRFYHIYVPEFCPQSLAAIGLSHI